MKIYAFYLPQFHEIPENNEWWGKGFTVWDNVRAAKPLFTGHQQPVIPLNNNYYDLTDINTIKWQTKLLNKYHLDGLVYYHYYSTGYKLLEKPAESLLQHAEIDQNFFFCWANHDWTNRWTGKDEKILVKQNYGNIQDWSDHFDYLLPFFKDTRYEKINNCPVFMVFMSWGNTVLRAIKNYFDLRCRQAGFNGIYWIDTYHGEPIKEFMHQYLIGNATFLHEPSIGFLNNSYTTVNSNTNQSEIKLYDGSTFSDYSYSILDKFKKAYSSIVFSWDNTPRWKERGSCISEISKTKLFKQLDTQIDADFIFINAWNEWDEGMMLEPTEDKGYKYLSWLFQWKLKNKLF